MVRRINRLQPVGSQLAVELALTAYAVVAGLIIIRALLLSVGISGSLWVGSFIYGITDPLASILKLVPGGDFRIINRLALADLTLVAAVVAFPLFLLARGPRD
ncbi:MAG TPA: hypothetical protein VFP05_03580 [Thermomicrobiales bacterium]|nr:hypothetical protein [Thermomicrobiales bacterium]